MVGSAKRLVDKSLGSARTMQIAFGGVLTNGAGCLGPTHRPHSPWASVSTLTLRILKLQADGAVDGEGDPAVINGLVALEDADTGDQWAPHRFACCCDCAYFLAKVLKSARGSSQVITWFLFCELSDASSEQEAVST